MGMIFPGMDPYLEDPRLWTGVHASLIVYTRDHLQPLLRPRYIAAIEERVFVEGPDREIIPEVWLKQTRPDRGRQGVALAGEDAPVVVRVTTLEVHETSIAILDRQSGQKVVTVIEVVSPANKYPGPGRKSYEEKQKEVLGSDTHLVEIDLVRTGHHVLAVPEWLARGEGPYDYLISANRARKAREEFELYYCSLRRRLPRIRIPLAENDPDAILDLQAVVNQTYEAGSYSDRIDYEAPCRPALVPDDQDWAKQRIREARQGGPG
jgi:hypothetical protein